MGTYAAVGARPAKRSRSTRTWSRLVSSSRSARSASSSVSRSLHPRRSMADQTRDRDPAPTPRSATPHTRAESPRAAGGPAGKQEAGQQRERSGKPTARNWTCTTSSPSRASFRAARATPLRPQSSVTSTASASAPAACGRAAQINASRPTARRCRASCLCSRRRHLGRDRNSRRPGPPARPRHQRRTEPIWLSSCVVLCSTVLATCSPSYPSQRPRRCATAGVPRFLPS